MNRFESDLRVPANHPSLRGHFPGQPIVPGVLLLDGVMEILWKETGRRVAGLKDVKFLAAMRPDEEARVVCDVDGGRVSFGVSVQRDGARVTVALGNLLLHADDGPSV